MAAGPPPDPYRPCVILSIASPSPKADPGPNRGGAETMWGRISFLLTAAAVGFGVAGCQAVPVMPPSAADVPQAGTWREIGRAHVGTPVTNAHLVCRLPLEKKKVVKQVNMSKSHSI